MKGKLSFTDGSKLEFAEYVVISGGKVNKVRYRYTWLLEDAVLTRWDNAPHHPELETYPHTNMKPKEYGNAPNLHYHLFSIT